MRKLPAVLVAVIIFLMGVVSAQVLAQGRGPGLRWKHFVVSNLPPGTLSLDNNLVCYDPNNDGGDTAIVRDGKNSVRIQLQCTTIPGDGLSMGFSSENNAWYILTQKVQGKTNDVLQFGTGGTPRWVIDQQGDLVGASDGAVNIGEQGDKRPKYIFSSQVTSGKVLSTGNITPLGALSGDLVIAKQTGVPTAPGSGVALRARQVNPGECRLFAVAGGSSWEIPIGPPVPSGVQGC